MLAENVSRVLCRPLASAPAVSHVTGLRPQSFLVLSLVWTRLLPVLNALVDDVVSKTVELIFFARLVGQHISVELISPHGFLVHGLDIV